MSDTSKQLTYRGRPLLRCGDQIYYGNMTDKYIILLHILATKTVGELQVPSSVRIELLYTDPDIKGKNKIVKNAERETLAEALDLASVWLDRYK